MENPSKSDFINKTQTIHEQVGAIQGQIVQLENQKELMILQAQAECGHPWDSLINYMSNYPYSSRLCKDCGLAEEEPYEFIHGNKRYSEVPEVSRSYAGKYLLTRISYEDGAWI